MFCVFIRTACRRLRLRLITSQGSPTPETLVCYSASSEQGKASERESCIEPYTVVLYVCSGFCIGASTPSRSGAEQSY